MKHFYPFTPEGWQEMIWKYLAHGHKCHDRDSNPHPVDLATRTWVYWAADNDTTSFFTKNDSFKLLFNNILYVIHRRLEKSSRNPLDLTIVVLRACGMTTSGMSKVVTYCKRQLRAFVGCSAFFEPGLYVVVCMAFNHWSTGVNMSGTLCFIVLQVNVVHNSAAVQLVNIVASILDYYTHC